MSLPKLPCSFESFPAYLEGATSPKAVAKAVEPFKEYESKLRQIYAQDPTRKEVLQNQLVPVYQDGESKITIKARDIKNESQDEKDRYLLPLPDDKHRKHGSPATTTTLKEFQRNFALFCESSLSDLKWDNVVAAGSAVVTPLLPVDSPHNESKRALRSYYHETLAPASDVDLFIYGLNEEQAIEKIKQIEASVRDAILSETTVVRTKNAITIVSEYPTRHIQIVLRIYKSISEILTGFDVDCACVAYDGQQVWAAPRALAAFATQVNSIDLTRRSPSYENRLSKYSHRGFEVYWPSLDRSRVDPTIFERAFNRVLGLARLLVLEKLPHPQDRDEYLTKRREERGRPEVPWTARFRHQLPGNIKDVQPDDIAEWYAEDDVSSYHTFTIPYGPRYTPKKIERLLFSKDLLLNAEFNKSKDRETNLHRHPAFFGRVEDVIQDCCGYCPKPVTDADLAAHEEESKIYISGDISFLKDDPGRQAIGSFNPVTTDDWTEMAYIGNTTRLCQAIVDKDLDGVKDWFNTEEADVNQRDHTGRTPLQLAVMCSTPEIVECLIEHGARIVARLYNGLTALHLASHRGNVAMVKLLLDKSEENASEEEKKEETRKAARRTAAGVDKKADEDVQMAQSDDEDDIEEVDPCDAMEEDDDDADDSMTEGSFVKVAETEPNVEDEKVDDPDVYDIDVVAWDSPVSALHLAIIAGHTDVIGVLIDKYGADVMLPVKLKHDGSYGTVRGQAKAAILTLLLPLDLPLDQARATIETLLQKNASPLQGDMKGCTAIQTVVYEAKTKILEVFQNTKPEATTKAVKHLSVRMDSYSSATVEYALCAAIRSGSVEMVQQVLSMGVDHTIGLEEFSRAYKAASSSQNYDQEEMEKLWHKTVTQPIIVAARQENMLTIVTQLVETGADVNTMTKESWSLVYDPNYRIWAEDLTVLDLLQKKRKELEEYVKQESDQKPPKLRSPEALKEDEHYLKGLTPGSYQHWFATKEIERAKYIQSERAKKYQDDFDKKKNAKPNPGALEKREAASKLIKQIQDVEDSLIKKGAKKFYELYPDLKEEENQYNPGSTSDPKAKEPKIVNVEFSGKDVTPARMPKYTELFEAVFEGDIEKVKALCLPSEDNPQPLQISVSDFASFNPFHLAVLRGHYDLAEVVLELTAAQYHDEDAPRLKYSLPTDNADDDDDGDNIRAYTGDEDEPPQFVTSLVDDNFTVNDIEAAQAIKADIRPAALVHAPCEVWRVMNMGFRDAMRLCRPGASFDPNPVLWESGRWAEFKQCRSWEASRTAFTLSRYAVITNDVKLLKFLFEMEVKHSYNEPEELLKSLQDPTDDLKLAMNLGRVEIIDIIIKYRGTLLPLHHLAKRSGIVIQETPKFYQGLSVYGQKRKDWAKQDQDANQVDKSDTGSPLLTAIMNGNLDVIDYFMSDTPVRRYKEFAERFQHDHRIRTLLRADGGIEATLKTWMNTRSNLVIHAAVMSWPARSNERLKYMMEKAPKEYLEIRSATGNTPLRTALEIRNWPAFEVLLAAGANQRTRDRKGLNVLHSLYRSVNSEKIAVFKKVLSMLNEKVIQELVMQRCSGTEPGSLTPLAMYLAHAQAPEESVLKELLEVSHQKDLTIMNGAGDYPLHVEVRNGRWGIAEFLAKLRPDLLYRENATGMTPIEVAEAHYFKRMMENPPEVSHASRAYKLLDRPDAYFVEKEKTTSKDEPSSMYAALVQIARENPRPRHLVSILDANEVARRLATQQHRKNAEVRRREAQGLKARFHKYYSRPNPYGDNQEYYEDGEGDGDGDESNRTDEVTKNMDDVLYNYRRCPWKHHSIEKPEELDNGLQDFRDFADGKTDVLKCCEFADNDNVLYYSDHWKMTSNIGEYSEVETGTIRDGNVQMSMIAMNRRLAGQASFRPQRVTRSMRGGLFGTVNRADDFIDEDEDESEAEAEADEKE